ncbi:MAG: TIGR02099 family protein, partial [Rhodoferax sp.]|nr:TIGR02099 family protein [Rhodoferax sp.]
MDDMTPVPSPLLKACAFIARWSLGSLLFAWFLFAAAWGALHLLIVPRIGELRPQLEATASRLLGVPVRIQAITAHSTGMIPTFELTNVSVLDEQGRDGLRLPRILVSLSPKSLINMRFEQLYIDRPTLNVRRATDGNIYVAGLDFSSSGADRELMNRLFSQPELVIRHGAVVWTDELRAVPPLALHDVDLVLRNHSRHHDLRLDATPPHDWGDRFGVVAKFEQPFLSMNNGRWQEWSGEAFTRFDRVDVSQLKRHADLGVDVQQGRGAIRAWADIRRGQLAGVTADVVLADVATRLDPALAVLQLASMSGRLTGKFSTGTLDFSTQGLAFSTADGLHWPGGNVHVTQVGGTAGRPAHGELESDKLDLAALTQIASRLPLSEPMHAALTRYAPRGLVERVKARWRGPADAIDTYEVQGRVQQLQLRALPAPIDPRPGAPVALGMPGISGATLDFELSESAGKASLVVQNGSIEFPGVFEEPVVPFTHLSTDMAWQVDGGKTRMQLANLRFSNPDVDGELQLKWQTSDPARSAGGARFPGVLDLQGSLSRADGTRVHRYLPLVVHKNARDYVRDAVQAGAGSGVKFKVKGDLHDMPFANPKLGEFLITANIKNALFAYVPSNYQAADSLPWPALTQLSGELVIDRRSLQVKGARGRLVGAAGLQITRLDGGIADMTQPATVAVGLEARGPLPEMLVFVNGSPLAALSGNTLARASASGSADIRLKLAVPLAALDQSSVQGNITLAGNDIQLSPDLPRMTRARGAVGFSESGFSVSGLQARVLGGDSRLDGGTVAATASAIGASAASAGRLPASVAFRAQGTISAEGLRQARELGFVARLAQYASGTAAYTAAFALRAGVPEMSLSSNLVGMALSLPAPLVKSADAAMPLRLDSSLVRDSVASVAGTRARLQDQLVMELGRIGSVNYVRDLSGPEPRVLRGAIALGLATDESAPLPQEGVVANVNMAKVDLDAWGAVLSQVSATPMTTSSAVIAPAADSGAVAARAYLPNSMALRARELTAGGYTLRNVVLGGAREEQTWRANLAADELNGYLEYRQASGAGAGRVFARLSRLTLAQASASDVETLLDDQPISIPALDVVVDELELRGKKLGRVEIEAVNRAVATRDVGLREWRLNKFDVITPDALFRATGSWAAPNTQGAPGAGVPVTTGNAEPRRTVMNFRLDIANSGDLLTRFGMKDVIRRGKGVMEGQVAWTGSPLTMDYPTLAGAFSVDIENGQFLKADPGLAKLLGVLSLQSLPRRLALDFRDVFTEGFAFDFFRGDVKINHGIASSNNLQMKGVTAAVLMDGTADLSRETQDIKVVVVPEINAGTASLIATAINPAIGLGTFLAQWFLRRPLMEAATQEFHVDGSWVDPKIQRVTRRPALTVGAEQS